MGHGYFFAHAQHRDQSVHHGQAHGHHDGRHGARKKLGESITSRSRPWRANAPWGQFLFSVAARRVTSWVVVAGRELGLAETFASEKLCQ